MNDKAGMLAEYDSRGAPGEREISFWTHSMLSNETAGIKTSVKARVRYLPIREATFLLGFATHKITFFLLDEITESPEPTTACEKKG